jgi:hypothetical protein
VAKKFAKSGLRKRNKAYVGGKVLKNAGAESTSRVLCAVLLYVLMNKDTNWGRPIIMTRPLPVHKFPAQLNQAPSSQSDGTLSLRMSSFPPSKQTLKHSVDHHRVVREYAENTFRISQEERRFGVPGQKINIIVQLVVPPGCFLFQKAIRAANVSCCPLHIFFCTPFR